MEENKQIQGRTTGIASCKTFGVDSPIALLSLSHRAPSINSPFTYTPTKQYVLGAEKQSNGLIFIDSRLIEFKRLTVKLEEKA